VILALPILALANLAHAACDEAPLYVERAEQAVLEGRLADATQALKDATVAWTCGPNAEPEVLARFWLAEGALAMAEGDLARARLSFSAAYRVAPDLWPIDYGVKPYIQYQAAAEEWTGQATIKLHPQPVARLSLLDGQPASYPATTVAGLHLVQLGRSEQHMEFASFVKVEQDDTFLVLTELEPVSEEELAAAPAPPSPVMSDLAAPQAPSIRRERDHPPALLASSGVALALAGTSAAMAFRQTAAMQEAPTEAKLHQAYARQQTYAQATWVLGGLGAVGLGLYLVF